MHPREQRRAFFWAERMHNAGERLNDQVTALPTGIRALRTEPTDIQRRNSSL